MSSVKICITFSLELWELYLLPKQVLFLISFHYGTLASLSNVWNHLQALTMTANEI